MNESLVESVMFDDRGLVVAVAQDALTGELRMVAYMNREAFERTVETGVAHFWSRSRKALWKKGETSGNTLRVRTIHVDCDGDAVLLRVDPAGPTCHTGADSCFFREARDGVWAGGGPLPEAERLYQTVCARKDSTAARSYTRSLLDAGATRIAEKLMEESGELSRAVFSESDARVASEAADVVFHLMVALASRGVAWRDVLDELSRRAGTSGHAEKAARGVAHEG